jgi:hypothetical protein
MQPLLDDQDRRLAGDPAARLALWRGLLTAGIEALGEVRDRDGELAGFLGGSLAAYARLPWQPTGIEAEVYFADLCELCVWENHGLLYQRETAPFAGVGVEHHELVERLLWSLAGELEGHRLGYQAEVAMGLVAYLQAATARLDRLVATPGTRPDGPRGAARPAAASTTPPGVPPRTSRPLAPRHGGGLARPVGPHEAEQLALADPEAEVVEGDQVAVAAGQPLQCQHVVLLTPVLTRMSGS